MKLRPKRTAEMDGAFYHTPRAVGPPKQPVVDCFMVQKYEQKKMITDHSYMDPRVFGVIDSVFFGPGALEHFFFRPTRRPPPQRYLYITPY